MIGSPAAAWNRFWFTPTSTAPLALFRVAFGLLVLAWALSLTLDVDDLFGPQGVVPEQPPRDGGWGILGGAGWEPLPRVLLGVLAIAAVALALGYRTRLAALVVFVAILSFSQRNPAAGNSGDALLRALAFFLVLAPAGAALSVDRWRRHRACFWESPRRAAWPQRLIQVQLAMLYLAAVWSKARGETWNDGTAVVYALRLEDSERFPLPDIGQWLIGANAATYAVLAIEFSLAVLVWQTRLRPWVLGAGIALHLGIEYGVRVGFFSWTILAAYIAWLPGSAGDRVVGWLRMHLDRRGYAPPGGPETARHAAD